MRNAFVSSLFAAFGLLTSVADAAPGIALEGGRARETAPGQTVGAGYVTIVNASSKPDRLLRVASPAAAEVQIHDTSMQNGMMQMRLITAGLSIPANARVELKPGSMHLMLVRLAKPLVTGNSFPVTFEFERSGRLVTQFTVESTGSASATEHR
jgi:copper(I)-binding protein